MTKSQETLEQFEKDVNDISVATMLETAYREGYNPLT